MGVHGFFSRMENGEHVPTIQTGECLYCITYREGSISVLVHKYLISSDSSWS